MQIPAFKKTADTDDLSASSNTVKPLPALVAVHINHSSLGLLFYRCSYGVFALSLWLVLHSFIIDQPLWLMAFIASCGGLWLAYRQQIRGRIAGNLGFGDDHWLLEEQNRTCQLELAGEVLVWSWLIILPLRETESGRHRQLLLFSDAMNKNDNARLRRWLRACLIPKA